MGILELVENKDKWVEFLDYNDDYIQCLNCKGLNECTKDNIGLKKNLVYREHEVSLELSSCIYGKSIEKKRDIDKQYVIKNVNDDLLFTDIKTLDIVKNIDKYTQESVEGMQALLEDAKGLYNSEDATQESIDDIFSFVGLEMEGLLSNDKLIIDYYKNNFR